jgi:hypothetical protein
MKIVKFKGGLGNQLFQYAFLRNLQLRNISEKVKADLHYYASFSGKDIRSPRIEMMNVILDSANQNDISDALIFKRKGNPLGLCYKAILFAEKTINKKYYFQTNHFPVNIDLINDYAYFDGYWQSWQIISEIEDVLRKELSPKLAYSEKTNEIINRISSENAVFIGLRRGDYLANSKAKKRFGSFDNDYFLKAVEIIKQKVDNPVFYMFSNDIDWVKRYIDLGIKINYREKDEQTNDLEELFVMSSFKHAIIVNSTFYWWGAWLIKNKNKTIIAPKKWFADGTKIDIIPNNWVKL